MTIKLDEDETVASLVVKVKAVQDSLNPSEQIAAAFFIQNPYIFLTMSVNEITQKLNISQASLVRFTQTIGFSGLKEFKAFLSKDLIDKNDSTSEDTAYADIRGEDGIGNLAKRVIANNIQAITETEKIFDFAVLDQVVELILAKKGFSTFGLGASGLVCQDLQSKFVRIGLDARFFTDIHMQITLASTLKAGDLAIVISNSGTTKDIIDVTESAKNAGAVVIAITRFGDTPLNQLADYSLYSVPEEASRRAAAMASRISQLTVVDFLYTAVANKLQTEVWTLLEESHNQLSEHGHI